MSNVRVVAAPGRHVPQNPRSAKRAPAAVARRRREEEHRVRSKVGAAVAGDTVHRQRRVLDLDVAGRQFARGVLEQDVDAVAELWFDDMETMQRAASSPEMKIVTDNGALYLGAIKTWVTEEKIVID